MAAVAGCPTNWQALVTESLEKARRDEPMKAVFGISLPESWKSELQTYVQNGELSRLFNVRAVSFEGKTISTFDAPKTTKEAPKAKKGG